MIEVNELLMKYGNREVLNISSFSLDSGRSHGLVGHNGAGKTTLFKCITNIICNYKGSITIGGTEVKKHNEILKDVGIVLDGMSVYQNQSGWFNIKYFSGLRGNRNDAKARELARDLDIEQVLGQKVKTYSYGMQKKLILLIALLSDPKVLILDEPFRGLDIDSVKWFKNYLKGLTEGGLTLFVSSHVRNDLEELCEFVHVIDKGRIIECIDLTAEKSKKPRLIDTSNNEVFMRLLGVASIPYELTEDHRVKVNVDDPNWNSVYAQLQKENIEITEMSQVKILEDRLN